MRVIVCKKVQQGNRGRYIRVHTFTLSSQVYYSTYIYTIVCQYNFQTRMQVPD